MERIFLLCGVIALAFACGDDGASGSDSNNLDDLATLDIPPPMTNPNAPVPVDQGMPNQDMGMGGMPGSDFTPSAPNSAMNNDQNDDSSGNNNSGNNNSGDNNSGNNNSGNNSSGNNSSGNNSSGNNSSGNNNSGNNSSGNNNSGNSNSSNNNNGNNNSGNNSDGSADSGETQSSDAVTMDGECAEGDVRLRDDFIHSCTNTCQAAQDIGCNEEIPNQRNDGDTDHISFWDCGLNGDYESPERTYRFVVPEGITEFRQYVAGPLTAFLVEDRGQGCRMEDCVNRGSGVWEPAVAGKTYYIVVDGFDGRVDGYRIEMECQ